MNNQTNELEQLLNTFDNEELHKVRIFVLFLTWAKEVKKTEIAPQDIDTLIQCIAKTPSMEPVMVALIGAVSTAWKETAPHASTDQSEA